MIAASTIFDQPWIILVALVIGFVRWLVSQKGQARKNIPPPPKTPTQPVPRDETQTEEERVRRFLEALGQPAGSALPRKVTPKREIQPRIFPPLPPLTTIPPPLPAKMVSTTKPPPLPRTVEPRKFTPAVASDLLFEIRGPGRAEEAAAVSRRADISPAGPSGLVARLATRQALRDAIVLREIFGPPRSLQPLDPISGF
jgi:hypothetical protein